MNSGFKSQKGIEAKHHNTMTNHMVSHLQFAAGYNRRISHAINFAHNAIFANNKVKEGLGIADLDFEAAFNLLCMQ